jgi:hypothetical protein
MTSTTTSTYHVLCLSKKIIIGKSYITEDDSLYNIKHDSQGRGLAIEKRFIQYTLHLVSQENKYYAIQLSTSDVASFGGKLCRLGHMEIKPGNYIDSDAHITHIPGRILTFCTNLDELHNNYASENRSSQNVGSPHIFSSKANEHDKDIGKICLQDDPNTFLFAFSADGGDERRPNGYAYVNMSLFYHINLH